MRDPIIIGIADIWGIDGERGSHPSVATDQGGRTHDVVLFVSGIALTHTGARCEGTCAIHGPSDHHMRDLPVFYRSDRNMIERICNHGVRHPDPDQIERWQQTLSPTEAKAQSVHGCCMYKCCEGSTKGEEEQ